MAELEKDIGGTIVTYFLPDERKSNARIPIYDILEIQSELFAGLK